VRGLSKLYILDEVSVERLGAAKLTYLFIIAARIVNTANEKTTIRIAFRRSGSLAMENMHKGMMMRPMSEDILNTIWTTE
jgi:hypothetical protein